MITAIHRIFKSPEERRMEIDLSHARLIELCQGVLSTGMVYSDDMRGWNDRFLKYLQTTHRETIATELNEEPYNICISSGMYLYALVLMTYRIPQRKPLGRMLNVPGIFATDDFKTIIAGFSSALTTSTRTTSSGEHTGIEGLIPQECPIDFKECDHPVIFSDGFICNYSAAIHNWIKSSRKSPGTGCEIQHPEICWSIMDRRFIM